MKKLLMLLFSLIFIFTSCYRAVNPKDILDGFCCSYGINAEVYHSGAQYGDDGYIDSEMLNSLYGIDEAFRYDFAIVMYCDVTRVREIAVFKADTGDERMYLFELITDRLRFLSSFADGEGFIKKYRGAIVYGFVDDADGVERAFDSLL